MVMPIKEVKEILKFVHQNEEQGCTKEDIKNNFPHIRNIEILLSKMSEGINMDSGLLLEIREGRYYIGPKAYLLND